VDGRERLVEEGQSAGETEAPEEAESTDAALAGCSCCWTE